MNPVYGFFKRFYEAHADKVRVPERLNQRELGYVSFKGVMKRHMCFTNAEEMRIFIRRAVPLHVYRSSAYYMHPAAPTGDKEWLGADLVFDIDADHLETGCRRKHDFNICQRCGEAQPLDVDACRCGNKLSTISWVCGECVAEARRELLKLLTILEDDFGLSKDDFTIQFSGNRGYHLIVSNQEILELDSRFRQELVNYVMGVTTSKQPSNQITARIDAVVTTDVHRLIRLGNTLNGKTGLLAKAISYDALLSFDPLRDAVALPDEELRVYVRYSPRFSLAGNNFGPYRRQVARLPAYAAAYLILRGLAEVR